MSEKWSGGEAREERGGGLDSRAVWLVVKRSAQPTRERPRGPADK